MTRSRTLMLMLPLALMAACSKPTPDTPAAGGTPAAAAAPATTLDLQRLQGNHWRLENATDASGKRVDGLFVRADKPVTLDFSNGQLAVSNTCNRLGGGYTLAGNTLTVAPMASTKMACLDNALMALDEAVGTRLEGALQVELAAQGPLTLRTAAGEVLVFAAEPTAETRYGGEGETVFIEVAAQTRPCSHPLIPDMQCLQTREVRFDANGLKQGTPGAFENFFGSIEGYTHEDGVRNVLRVKRYTIANPPADGSSQAYVLDMVVETETVAPGR